MSKEGLPAGTKALIYATPALSLILFATSFAWLAHLQLSMNQVSRSIIHVDVPSLTPEDEVQPSLPERVKRMAQSTSGLSHYFNQIALHQLKALKATCAANETLCVQGPKGDTGPSGETGSAGKLGASGPKGDKGDVGPSGPRGARGNSGPRVISVDPPVLVFKPIDVVGERGGEVQFECRASGFPMPSIRWRKVQGSIPVSRSKTSASIRHKLIITNVQSEDEGIYSCIAENVFGVTESRARLSIKTYPRFTHISPDRLIVLPGETQVTLPCKATGFPEPKITWTKDNALILEGANTTVENGSLVLMNFHENNNGNYSCRAENVHGRIEHTASVSLYDGISVLRHGMKVKYNTKAVIKCSLCPYNDFKFDWKREGGELPANRSTISESSCNLVIQPTRMEDTGNYTCIASSRGRYSVRQLEDQAALTVLGLPKILSSFPKSVSFTEGGNIDLRCLAVGPPNPEVYWTKGSKKLFTNDPALLSLRNMSSVDEGTYSCHAVNAFGKATATIRTIFLSPPKFTKMPPTSLTVSSSGTVSIDCQVQGSPTPTVRWSPPCGKTLDRMQVLTNGTLVLRDVSVWDTGIYECSAVNIAGGGVTAKSHVIVGNIDTTWKLSDRCSGFKQSLYNKNVYYLASSSNIWSVPHFYNCPAGYHWACTSEGKEIFGNNNNWSGKHVYYSKCGWSGYNYSNRHRFIFRFRDSSSTNAYKHAGHFEEYRMDFTSQTTSFAGIVCIKN